MLYLESPAGSGSSHGYSECIKAGSAVACHWDDVSQAEAYSHTLQAFKVAFPEFAANSLYLTGESYFGQYGRLARWALLAQSAPPSARSCSPRRASTCQDPTSLNTF